jgi:hypothetical protein
MTGFLPLQSDFSDKLLGYRTDPKERGRFVELFFAQAENGNGITQSLIDLAIKKYHAKQAVLDVIAAKEKVST